MQINIQPIAKDHPALDQSKLLDALIKTIAYAKEHEGIGLTATKAFNRKFAHWGAENFDWPEYSAEKLLRIQKVLNEEDVAPVMVLHDLLTVMKFGRHVKGKFKIGKQTHALVDDRGALFVRLAECFLFQYNHARLQRHEFVAMGNWDIFLNVINVKANTGVTEGELLEEFYGLQLEAAGSREFWDHASFLMWHVLRPLSWLGFLQETKGEDRYPDKVIYTKTALWRECFKLDTDDMLRPYAVH